MTVDCGCLFVCQNEGILRHFRRVENQAGERVGVADAPLPDSHRTATPTVSRLLAILKCKFLGVSIWHQESKQGSKGEKSKEIQEICVGQERG